MFRAFTIVLVVSTASLPVRAEDEHRTLLARTRMVQMHIAARGIRNPRILGAMSRVRRHEFVPLRFQHLAYADQPLPIGHEQTISQPYIVALMTQLGAPERDSKVLDVGTGSGYQAAVLAELADQVYGIEIICPLAQQARTRLDKLGYRNITLRCGDGYRGWPKHAPFDLIILAAAPEKVPQPLLDQLAPKGRLVLPIGGDIQQLVVYQRLSEGRFEKTVHGAVRFVPMTGEIRKSKAKDVPLSGSPAPEK